MSSRRRRGRGGRARDQRAVQAAREFWGIDFAQDEPPVPIRRCEDPSAMIRSLGPPPLAGRDTIAGHYFNAVYDKAAALAVAVAAASGLLATEPVDPDR